MLVSKLAPSLRYFFEISDVGGFFKTASSSVGVISSLQSIKKNNVRIKTGSILRNFFEISDVGGFFRTASSSVGFPFFS